MKVREVVTVDPVSCDEARPISIFATVMLARDGPLDNAEFLSVVWKCAARRSVPAVRESQRAASH